MPPRSLSAAASSIFSFSSLFQSLPAATRPQALTQCSACLFSTTAVQQAKRKKKVKKHADPYRAAQAKQRRTANLARQEALQRSREESMGDPVRSRPTSFVESLRQTAPAEPLKSSHLNYFLHPAQMQQSIEHSKWLTEPVHPKDKTKWARDPNESIVAPQRSTRHALKDPEQVYADSLNDHETGHENASQALSRITDLENASGRDRTRVSIQRCIEEFGRHNTDAALPPKPASTQNPLAKLDEALLQVPKRSGPDTGSSEVQIAILTAKINVLADNLYKKDKHNKRNLRLLVHRRQKLLNYLRKKERGGPRWLNIVDKLGINDAMWQGEISL